MHVNHVSIVSVVTTESSINHVGANSFQESDKPVKFVEHTYMHT